MRPSLFFPLVAAAGVLATTPAEVVSQLRAAATQSDRVKILSNDKDYVFDFYNATAGKGAGGSTIAAAVNNFPALVNQGLAMTIGMLGPCGMNTPHTHPRATEMLFLVNGTLTTGMITENGARFVYNKLEAGMAQVFLQGSIHYQQNEGCDPVMFVAALNNEDPGVMSAAQRYFGLPPDVVAASLGDVGVEEVVGLEAMIPDNVALGLQRCLDYCGIKRGMQPSNQRQPRVGANALPSMESTWPATKTKSYSPAGTATHFTRQTMPSSNVFGALAADAATAASGGVSSTVVIALGIAVGAMAIGYLAIGIFWLVTRKRRQAEQANRWYVRPDMSGRSLVPNDEKYDTAQ